MLSGLAAGAERQGRQTGEILWWVSAAKLSLLENHRPNKNWWKFSPVRESGFQFSVKPVRNIGFVANL